MSDAKDIILTRKTRNIFLGILAVSLAVNLFIAGAITNSALGGHRAQSHGYDKVERRIFRRVSEADRPATRKIMSAHHDNMKMLFTDYRKHRNVFATTLASPGMSYDEISRSADDLHKSACALSNGFRAVTLDIIRDASPKTRKAIARSVKRF